ncbi:snare associated Golgi protein-domain-containing protein [Pavlovales sp. CCMP2436]|nr:snare associated Golgi protein-domain-containing protein [Pavlovales sp. CCMP2436]|mmetsp:Transcript_9953/g.25015  ORF Transcript_9953/g.25015 Transcript_9953/m.25015 type:complete len:350 (+) Transcript_9953:60-1109(+)
MLPYGEETPSKAGGLRPQKLATGQDRELHQDREPRRSLRDELRMLPGEGTPSKAGAKLQKSEPGQDSELRHDVTCLAAFFCLGLFVLYCAVSVLPPMNDEDRTHMRRPRDIAEFHAMQAVMLKYKELNSGAVLAVFMCTYVFMQSFAIPGSVVFSLLSGPLFGPFSGWCLVCLATTTGAIACYCVSNLFMRRILLAHFPARVAFLEQKVCENSDNIFYMILSLRMSPLLPNWFINAASPVAGVSMREFALATGLGLMPINFLHVQAGMTLGYAHSLSSALHDYRKVLLLLSLSLLALVPVYIKARRKNNELGQRKRELSEGDIRSAFLPFGRGAHSSYSRLKREPDDEV